MLTASVIEMLVDTVLAAISNIIGDTAGKDLMINSAASAALSVIFQAGGYFIGKIGGSGGSGGSLLACAGAGSKTIASSGTIAQHIGLAVQGVTALFKGANALLSSSGVSSKGAAEAEAIYSKVENVISKIPNSLKVYGKCDGFAEALVEGLKNEGIDYEIIRIDSTSGIYSDKAGESIGQGFHYGIKVNNMVYDNMTLNGMGFDAWLTDLGADGRYPGITWSVTNTILNK